MSDELRVCMPGKIVTIDFKTQKASVQPDFKRKYNDGTEQSSPIIYNVPIAHPRAKDAFVVMPLKKGDSVTLIFSDRSLEKWLSSGAEGDPGDERSHHISDAFAIPGGYAFSDLAGIANGDDLIIKNKKLEIRCKKNGHIQVLNSAHELISVLEEWMNASISGAHTWKIRIRRKLRTFLES